MKLVPFSLALATHANADMNIRGHRFGDQVKDLITPANNGSLSGPEQKLLSKKTTVESIIESPACDKFLNKVLSRITQAVDIVADKDTEDAICGTFGIGILDEKE